MRVEQRVGGDRARFQAGTSPQRPDLVAGRSTNPILGGPDKYYDTSAFAQVPGLAADTTLSYVGSRPVDAQNSGFVPGYTLWDAGLSYATRLGDTPTTFRLQGKNLANRYYYSGVYYSGGLDVGREREVFLSAKFSF